DHPKIPLSGSTSLAAAKADDAEPLLADISRAADAETAYLWQQSRKTRANIYRREHKLADLHHGVGRKAGFRDLDPETNRAMKQATEGGRVIQMLRAEIAFTSAADAKKLEQQVTRGYRKWRAANPDTPLILRSMAGEWRPSVIGEKPGLSVRTLLYFGEE
ncbi:MAG TPA: hypothetical protein VJJ83_04640, partial [Candidatus Babeliales bacterium]|nr:hypothetical protein [Candidatus Babeliales bacterium]